MDWTIRPAGPDDADRLALVGAATFLETFADVHTGDEIVAHCRTEHGPAAYQALLRPGTDAWIAELARTAAPIGYAMLTVADLPGANDGDLELKRIYTLSRFHGTGLGAELMRIATDRARARGAGRLLLDVYSGNARAIAFYRRHGFVQIADNPFMVGDTAYDDIVLALPLG